MIKITRLRQAQDSKHSTEMICPNGEVVTGTPELHGWAAEVQSEETAAFCEERGWKRVVAQKRTPVKKVVATKKSKSKK